MPAVGAVRCLAVSQNGRQIASGTVRGEVILWDGETYQRTSTLKQGHAGITAVDFSPDSTRLVAASEDGRAGSIWNTIAQQRTLTLDHDHGITAAKYSPQGDRIATATAQSTRVWDSEDGLLLLDIPVCVTPWLNTGLVWSSHQLLVVSRGKIKQIDASTGSSISECPLPDVSNHFPCITLSQHGTFIVSSGKRAITFLSKETHAQLGLVQHVRDIRSVALSPNDQFLAVGGEGGKITIKGHHVLAEPDFYINDKVLDLWKCDQFVNTEVLLTATIHKSSNPSMCSHVLAGRALVRGRLHEWDIALDDAKQSIRIEPSVIGFIAKSVALVGKGKRHEAYRACDIALEQFYSTHVSFLLLIKAIIAFMAGDHKDAIARIDDLISTACLNPTYHVVQAHMYLLLGDQHMEKYDYEGAIRLFQRARAQARHHHPDRLLFVISLISGWKFDDLVITTQQRLCEALYFSGRVKEAGESLLRIVETLDNELYKSSSIDTWVSDFMRRCLSTPERSRHAAPETASGGKAPTFQFPTPILREWAKLKLRRNSWKDTLVASAGFMVPKFTIYLVICERLETIDYITDAIECLQQMVSECAKEADVTDEQANWVAHFKLRCAEKSVCFGDMAVAAQQYDDAIAWYSTALSLNPSSPHDIFIKRCKVYLAMELWENALDDTNKVMLFDPSSLFRPEMVLEEWASAELTDRSWRDSLSTASDFSVPRFAVYRALCDRLEMVDRAMEALNCFRQMESELAGDIDVPNERMNWVVDFKQRCAESLERLGDAAVDTQRYDDAITLYSTSLSLDPAAPQDIVVKRGMVYMETHAWDQAIDDMNHVTAIDPLSPQGYEKVLTTWAKAALSDGSWKDALAAAENFQVPKFAVYRTLCEYLVALDCVVAATECFHGLESTFARDPEAEEAEWFRDFRSRCCGKLETLGDAAMADRQCDEAISLYSVALSLSITSLTLLAKRSKAHADKGLWEAALNDANKAIVLDRSKPLGYERKYVALHGAGYHTEALSAFETMLSKMSRSTDPEIRERYRRYNETRDTIRAVVQNAIRESPRVLINTISGRLCNKSEQAAAFELLPIFTELISSTTVDVDLARIQREVAEYYRYATFSHKWEDNEPLFEKVIHIAVYELDESPTHDKLQMFCNIVREAGFFWAWSDTCCINKADNSVLQESLVAMFKWYRGSAVTIVFLRGVCSPSKRGDLVKSIWNTRAWTFQEYHASNVVRFYTEDWVPYLNLDMPNHKESPQVISEMEEATGVSAEALMKLQPGLDHIREKLRLASKRHTTLIEDAAYSLLGIFSATGISPIYGEGHGALGRLLAHVLSGSGDMSILAWTGESSSYNSCLPAYITVFDGPCTSHFPRHIDNAELNEVVTRLRASPPTVDAALQLYDCLYKLPPPWFAAKRMRLPCLAFKLPPLSCHQTFSGGAHYRVETRTFGTVDIRTREDLSQQMPLYLIHPWFDSFFGYEEMHSASNGFTEDVQEPSGSPGATDDEDAEDDSSSSESRPTSPAIDRETCAPGSLLVSDSHLAPFCSCSRPPIDDAIGGSRRIP